MTFPTVAAYELYQHLETLEVSTSAQWCPKVERLLKPFNITQHGRATAYTLPWLSAEDCEALRTEFDLSEYSVNEEENVEARIPEIVLAEHHTDLHNQLAELFSDELLAIVGALTGHKIATFESIQLAKYSPDGVAQGTWHTDQDSDITITVALNDDYEGGGLRISEGGHYGAVHEIPKQPTGTATIFCGRTCHHYGLPVTKGTRDLLVFWCKI